jgi:hypothetical protein
MVAGWKHTFKLRIDLDQSCKNREKNRLPAPKLLGPEGAVGFRASNALTIWPKVFIIRALGERKTNQ